jgi:antitoxin VapB
MELPVAFHVRDPRTDALVRELARRRGIGLTEAIREAVESALADSSPDEPAALGLRQRLGPLLDRMDAYPRTGEKADKAFFDDMWGD